MPDHPVDHHSPVYRKTLRHLLPMRLPALKWKTSCADGTEGLAEDMAPTLYYRWIYRTIQGRCTARYSGLPPKDLHEKFESRQNHRLREFVPALACQRHGGATSAPKSWRMLRQCGRRP